MIELVFIKNLKDMTKFKKVKNQFLKAGFAVLLSPIAAVLFLCWMYVAILLLFVWPFQKFHYGDKAKEAWKMLFQLTD